MYNNNDTITQGRNKAPKQNKDKKLHFKSMAASSFVGAMAGAGAMWLAKPLPTSKIMSCRRYRYRRSCRSTNHCAAQRAGSYCRHAGR